jgi:WD40 repeat protein
MDRRLDRHVRRTQRRGLVYETQSRRLARSVRQCRLYSVRLPTIAHTYSSCAVPLTRKLCACCSKVWDTYSGQPLHSFPHNHIVRSVAISPSYLLTGGQEKKVRIFDIGKPDAEPDILSEGGGLSHDGTIKSVVWFDENTGVSGGEDRIIKWVIVCLS